MLRRLRNSYKGSSLMGATKPFGIILLFRDAVTYCQLILCHHCFGLLNSLQL